MSNTPRATMPPIPELSTGETRRIGKADKSPFIIDGVTYHLIRPKSAMLASVASVLDMANPASANNAPALLQFVAQLLQYIERTPPRDGELTGRALLEQRLADPLDPLDLQDLLALFDPIMAGWFGRPTGSPRASTAPRQARRTAGSRARTR